jgi:hypothetical protein
MGTYSADLPGLIVSAAAGAATSNIITGFADADSITITAPATLSNTHHVQVHTDATAATSSAGWATLIRSGSAVSVSSAQAVTVTDISFAALRVSSMSGEAAPRAFTVAKQFSVGRTGGGGSSVGLAGSSGTTNTIPKFASGTTLGNSLLSDDGTNTTLASGQMLLPAGTEAVPALAAAATSTSGFYFNGTSVGVSQTGATTVIFNAGVSIYGSNGLALGATRAIGWGSGSIGTIDTVLVRDAANTLALRNGTAAQTFNQYATYTDASNYIRLTTAVTSTNIGISAVGLGTGATANVDITLTPINTGRVKIGSPALVALGGGAAPTLGTIGGSGPTVAGQNAWLELKDSAGATIWIPVWK